MALIEGERQLRTGTDGSTGFNNRIGAVTDLFHSYLLMRKLTEIGSEGVINDYALETSRIFEANRQGVSTVVMVCARNEVQDLPRTLVAFALSNHPINPIIIDNGSTDGTGEIARDMGASVVVEGEKGLIRALSTGFMEMGREGVKDALMTDADTFPIKSWGGKMVLELRKMGSPGQVMGLPVFHGKMERDVIRTVGLWFDYARDDLLNNRSRGRGFNSAITSGPNSDFFTKLGKSLNLKVCTGTDEEVERSVLRLGGLTKSCYSPEAIVLTSGDRYKNVWQVAMRILGFSKSHFYKDWQKSNVS